MCRVFTHSTREDSRKGILRARQGFRTSGAETTAGIREQVHVQTAAPSEVSPLRPHWVVGTGLGRWAYMGRKKRGVSMVTQPFPRSAKVVWLAKVTPITGQMMQARPGASKMHQASTLLLSRCHWPLGAVFSYRHGAARLTWHPPISNIEPFQNYTFFNSSLHAQLTITVASPIPHPKSASHTPQQINLHKSSHPPSSSPPPPSPPACTSAPPSPLPHTR